MISVAGEKAREPLIKGIFDVSGITLIISNIITIFLAVTGGWSLKELMIVYWAQSVIIGFFVFLKILSLKKFSTENFKINDQPVKPTRATKYFTAFFFLIHYGGFHLGYLIFLSAGFLSQNSQSPTVGTILAILFSIILFFADHLFSFIYNFKKDSNKQRNIGTVMFFPYARIIPMHLTIVFGFFLIESTGGLVFFLILKTLADGIMHAVEHRI
jgi:hypothetical protein